MLASPAFQSFMPTFPLPLAMTVDPFGITTLDWDPPALTGGFQIPHDAIRSIDPGDFVVQGECLESGDGSDTQYFEFDDPPMEKAFFYLVRARIGCPAEGLVGANSRQHLRMAKDCP